MKSVKKLLLCLIAIMSVSISGIMPANATSTGGGSVEIKAPRKIVSLVFDDSSSMFEDGIDFWAQANYATQVFSALMDSQDEFYITYMSKEEPREIDLSDPQRAVDTIRTTKTDWYLTPLSSVDIAKNKLESINESDPTTQFWLVIITDGIFQNSNSAYSDIKSACDELAGKTMSNGSPLHVYYYGFGNAGKVESNPAKGLESVESDDIVHTLNDMANLISGRMKYDNKDIKIADDRTIEISSDIPLYSLSAFTQNSKAEVVSAKVKEDSKKLDFNNVKVQCPNPSDIFGDDSEWVDNKDIPPSELEPIDLNGNVSVISNSNQAIPAGTYTIEFSDPIDKDSLVLMYQPAVILSLALYKDGNEVKDYSQIIERDDIELRLIVLDPSTGEEMDLGLLPSGTEYEITEKGDRGDSTVSGMTKAVEDIAPGSYSFTASMAIPGMMPVYSNTISITVEEYRPEPSIHLTIYVKGSIQDDIVYDSADGTNLLDSLEADDVIDVKAEAIDNNTGELIDASMLHDPENWNISYQVDGNEEGSRPENEYKDIKLIPGNNRIVCDYETGGATAQEAVEFNVPDPAVYALEVGKDKGSYFRKDLNKEENVSEAPVIWIIRDDDANRDGIGDGNPQRLSKSETKGARQLLLDTFTVERDDFGFFPNKVGFINANIELVQNADGSYSAVPRTGLFKKLLVPYLITTGNYHINTVLDVNAKEQEVVVEIKGKLTDWIPFIIEIIILWLLYRIIYMFFFKPKFARGQSLNLSAYNKGGGGKLIELSGQNEQILLKPYGEHPFSKKPAMIKVRTLGITVYATSTGSASINTYSSYSGDWGINSSGSKKFDVIKKDIKAQTELRNEKQSGEPDITHISNEEIYFYEGGTTMYALSVINE